MLEKIIKAYDIRGLVKDEITPDFSFSLGVAYAKFLELEREPATIVVGAVSYTHLTLPTICSV